MLPDDTIQGLYPVLPTIRSRKGDPSRRGAAVFRERLFHKHDELGVIAGNADELSKPSDRGKVGLHYRPPAGKILVELETVDLG